MNLIKKILGSLEARLGQSRFNLWRTVYFNFRTLPFSDAIKMPVYIYGRVRFYMLNGCVEFKDCDVKRGMVKIGKVSDCFHLHERSGFISLASFDSKLIFNGKVTIGVNAKIRVLKGVIEFGNEAFFGSNVKLVANGADIIIGGHSRIAFETNIVNSGFHYVYNKQKGCYANCNRSITIGEYNWIGNRSSITAGAKTKGYTIICSNSLVGKDYSSIEEENPMLGGMPAKIIASGMKRVFSPETHMKIDAYFNANPAATVFKTEELVDDILILSKEF